MTDAATQPTTSAAPPVSATQQRYTAVAIALHWIIAFSIIGMIAVGWTMENLDPSTLDGRAQYQSIVQLHKSFGITILLLSVARIAWRLMNPPPPEPPMPGWQAFAANAVHVLFYILMIAMPLSGWIMASASPAFETKYFGLFDARLPVLPTLPLESREAVDETFGSVHSALAWVVIGLLVLHVAGAVKHHFIDKDGLLARMAPGLFGRTAGPLDKGHGEIWAFGSAVVVFATILGASMALNAPASLAAAVMTEEEEQQPASSAPTWVVDAAKSTLKFRFGYMGQDYEGTFPEWTARIQLDTDAGPNQQTPVDGYVRVAIPLAKVSTGESYFDGNVTQGDWFDVGAHPEAVFEVKGGIYKLSPTDYEATGVLTLKGVAHPVRLHFTLAITNEGGAAPATMHGEVTLNRLDLGVGKATIAEARGDEEWVANPVQVIVDVVATRQ
jgi:cytochrome b561/polyisoprenoid-binding protein YceI